MGTRIDGRYMIRDFFLDQAVHGYRRGHELLASSTQLDPLDADRVAQLSDLSGLPVESQIPSYLSCYPLPSGKYYAVAKTWPDKEARREGCVLTHTILIPMDVWQGGLVTSAVLSRFCFPSRSNLSSFHERVLPDDFPAESGTMPPGSSSDRVEFEQFATQYFALGKAPIVWFNQATGSDILPRLIDFLWPSLRCRFAACTYSLQTRHAGDSQFDLMFAPAAAVSRFSRVPENQLIGHHRGELALPPSDHRTLKLVDMIFRAVVEGEAINKWSLFPIVRAVLPPDSTALLKLILLDELNSRSAETASSAVAALDVLAALVPDPEHAVEEKGRAIAFAVKRAASQPLDEAIELLAAIAQRCTRAAFRRLRNVRRGLVREIGRITAENPERALSVLARSKGGAGALAAGIGRGLASSDVHAHRLLSAFDVDRPEKIDLLLRYAPELAPSHLAVSEDSDDQLRDAIEDVVRWVGRAKPYVQRSVSQAIIETPLFARDDRLIRTALEHAGSREVRPILSGVLNVPAIKADILYEVRRLGTKFPDLTRDTILKAGVRSELAGILFADSLPISPEVLKMFDEMRTEQANSSGWALAAYLVRPGVMEQLERDIAPCSELWIATLLSGAHSASATVAGALSILLNHFDNENLAIVLQPSGYFDRSELSSITSDLGAAIFRGALQNYLDDPGTIQRLSQWLENDVVSRWLRAQDDLGLSKYGDETNVRAGRGTQLWRALALIAKAIPGIADVKLSSVCSKLFALSKARWSEEFTEEWCDVLRAARGSSQLSRADVDAMSLALSNPNLPLSALLVETYVRVYRSVAPDVEVPLFGFFWSASFDPGYELRSLLITAFVRSSWAPGILAFIADRAGILDKVIVELRRQNEDEYVDSMLNDLVQPDGHNPLASKVRRLIGSTSSNKRRR
jgi:hypothetical protein